MSDNIHVAVRVRPLIPREIKDEARIHWKVEDGCVIYQASSIGTSFRFDRVFDARESNDVVYGELCSPIVESVMQGINGTIFAYGQTSSGKTFTMMGDAKNSGIIRSTVEDIFNAIENMPNREFLLRVSYMEIYNEMVMDLFSTEEKKNLKVQEDTDGYTSICGLEEIVIKSTQDVLNWMKKGERKRHIGETNMNERSSRSHTIFRMIIESRRRDTDEDGAVIVSQFNLVDLAGSERASETFTSERFKESVSINKSLLTLSQVISQLSENDGQHIGYRASKLTRILKNSLGGNARTVIICTVTPASVEQTLSTLKFASRAKCIKNKPQINEVLTDEAELKRYAKKVKELTKQLEEQQNGDVKAMQLELEEKDRKIENLRQSLKDIKEKLIVSHNPPEMFSAIPRNPRRETWGGLIMKQNFRPPQFDNLKSFCHLAPLPTLLEESFTAITDLSNEFSPEYREDLLSGGCKLTSSPHCLSMSPLRLSYPTTDVEVQTETSLRNIIDSEVQTDFESAESLGLQEENLKLKSDFESLKKKYEELREFTALEKEICGTDNGLTNEIQALQEKIKFLQEGNTDLFAKLKSSSDKVILKEQAAEDVQTELVKQLDDKERNVSSLNEKLTALEQEIESLNSQLQAPREKIKSLQEENTDLFNKLKSTSDKIIMKEQAAENMQTELLKQLDDKERNVSSLNEKLTALEQEIESLNSQLQAPQEKIKSLQEENTDLFSKLKSTSDKIIMKEQAAENMQTELLKQLDDKERNVSSLNEKLAGMEQEIESLNSQLMEMSRESVENLSAQFKEANESNLVYQNLVKDLKAQVNSLQESNRDLAQKMLEIESSYFDAQNEVSRLINELSDKDAIIANIDNQLRASEELSTDQDIKIKRLSSKVSELSDTLRNFSIQSEDMQNLSVKCQNSTFDELQVLEFAGNESVSCANKLDGDRSGALMQEIKDKEMKIITLSGQLEECEEQIQVLTSKIEVLNSNRIETSDLIEDLQAQIKSEKENNAHYQPTIETLKNNISELQEVNNSLKEKLAISCCNVLEVQSVAETDRLLAEEEKIGKCPNELLSKYSSLLEEKDEIIRMMTEEIYYNTACLGDIKNIVDDFVLQKHECFKESVEKVMSSYSEINTVVSEIFQHFIDVPKEIELYSDLTCAQEKEMLALTDKLVKSENLLSEKESLLNLFAGELGGMEDIVQDMRNQLETSKDRLRKPLSSSCTKCLELKTELKCVSDKISEKESECLSLKNQLSEIQNVLNEKVSLADSLLEQLDQAQEDSSSYRNEIGDKEKIILDYKNIVSDLEGKITDLIPKKDTEISQLNNQITDLQGVVNAKVLVIGDLEKQSEQSHKTIVQLEREIVNKKCTISDYENLISEFERNAGKLKEEVSWSKVQLTSAEESISEYKKELELKKSIISDYESHFNNLKKDFEDVLSKLRASHESEVNKINDINNKKIVDLREDLEQKHREQQEKLANQFEDDLELKMSELGKKYCEDSIKEKCKTEERLKLELSASYEKQLNFLKKELQEKESAVQNKLEKLKKAEGELAVLRAKNQKKNELLSVVNERHEAAVSAIMSDKDAVIQGLKRDLENKITECDTLKKELDILSRKNEISTEESLSALKELHKKEILQINECHEKEKLNLIENVTADFIRAKEKMSEELTSKLKASYENEIHQMNDLHEKAKQSLIESLVAEFSAEKEKLADQFNKQLEFKLSEFQRGHLEHSMKQQNETEERLTLELGNKYEKQLVSLKHELIERDNTLRSKLEMLEKTEREMTSLRMEKEKANELLSKINEEHQRAIAAVAAEKDNMIQGLKRDLEFKLNECNTLKKELDALLSKKDEISMQQYKNELTKSMNKCQELDLEMNKKSDELLQLKSDFEKKGEAACQKIAEQDKLIQHLQLSFNDKSAECVLLKQQFEELSSKTNPDGSSESLESYKCRIIKEINAYRMKKSKEMEHLKFLYEKEISEKAKIHDQIMLDMKEKNEKLTCDFNKLVCESEELKATCKDRETQNKHLIGVLKGETKWLEQQNSDVKAHKEEIRQKNSLLTQLNSDFSKQSTELASLRNERQILVGEIDKLKNEIVARNEVCKEQQKKIELLQNSQNISLNNKDDKNISGKDKIEKLAEELVDEKLKNEKLLEGLKHWTEKAENYKLQVKRLKEVKECTTSLDKLPKAVVSDEDGNKPSDETDYCFQSGAIAKYKLYMMDSELYQKNKEIDRLKKEINRLKSIIANKRASKNTKLGQETNGVPTAQQPTGMQNETSEPACTKSRTRKRSENDVSSVAKKLSGVQNAKTPVKLQSAAKRENDIPSIIKATLDAHSENTLSTFVRPQLTVQSENLPSADKKFSEMRNESIPVTLKSRAMVQTTGVTVVRESDVFCTGKKPTEVQIESVPPTFVKPMPKAHDRRIVQNEGDFTLALKSPPESQNENIPPTSIKPRPRAHNKITLQSENDMSSAIKIQTQNIAPVFAKPKSRTPSETDAFSAVSKPSHAQNENVPPMSVQHRPTVSSEIKMQSETEGPSLITKPSEVGNENVLSTFLKRRSTVQHESNLHSVNGRQQGENVPPTFVRTRSKVRSENDTPLGTKLLSQTQQDGAPRNVKPLSEEQSGNGNAATSENLQPAIGSTKTVSAPVKSFSSMQSVDSIAATKPLTQLQTARSSSKPVLDKAGTTATRMVHDGSSTEMKKFAVPVDNPQRGKRKFSDTNECKQQ